MRFAPTAEARLNDGPAFPFVNFAVALAATHGAAPGAWALEWPAVGWAVGAALGWLTFRVPKPCRAVATGEGFVALGIAFLAYGVAELAHGHGSLAVPVAALAGRAAERGTPTTGGCTA